MHACYNQKAELNTHHMLVIDCCYGYFWYILRFDDVSQFLVGQSVIFFDIDCSNYSCILLDLLIKESQELRIFRVNIQACYIKSISVGVPSYRITLELLT